MLSIVTLISGVALLFLLDVTKLKEYASARFSSSSDLNSGDWISLSLGTFTIVSSNSDGFGGLGVVTAAELDTTLEAADVGEMT